MAVQSAGTGVNVAFGVVAGLSLLPIILFAGLRLRDLLETSDRVQPGVECTWELRQPDTLKDFVLLKLNPARDLGASKETNFVRATTGAICHHTL